MVQIIIVDRTVIIKYLNGNLAGIGLKVFFKTGITVLRTVVYHARRFLALLVSIMFFGLNAGHLILVEKGYSNTREGFL